MKAARIIATALSVITLAVGISGCEANRPPSETSTPDVDVIAPVQTEVPITFLGGYLPAASTDYTLYIPGRGEPAKAIYVSPSWAASEERFAERMQIAIDTEINAIVVDIKEIDGIVNFMGIERADELGVSSNNIQNIKSFIKNLHDHGIYVIGRIVALKDDSITEVLPELSLHLPSGQLITDLGDPETAWLNPYHQGVWDYLGAVSEGAAQLGFDEIQFDYFRFPSRQMVNDADFGDTRGLGKTEIITELAKYLVGRLKPYGVTVGVDVFGIVAMSDLDADIVGQDFKALTNVLDFICPMPYPSHFAKDSLGIEYPDMHPYETIYNFMEACSKKLDHDPALMRKVRPWLQDFTLPQRNMQYQTYGKEQVRGEINAVYDSGYSGWMLWSSGGTNTVEALNKE